MESRHSQLRLLLTRRNISSSKPSGLGNSLAFFLLKFTCIDAGRSQQTETKTKPAVKRRFLPFLKSSKGLFWPFFCQFIRGNGMSGVGYIDYENFTGKTFDPKKIF